MKPWTAIFFTLGLIAVSLGLSYLVHFDLTWFMVPATSLWAAWDSSKIQLKKYKPSFLGLSYGPVGVFIMCLLLWFVTFPVYLATRYKVLNGRAELKDEYKAAIT